MVQIYVSTENAELEVRERFYNQLQGTHDSLPSHDLKIMKGDWNAKVRPYQIEFTVVVAPHGSTNNTDNNGERMIGLCNENNLRIGNCFFKHRYITKWTWRSPDESTFNEIDYIRINKG